MSEPGVLVAFAGPIGSRKSEVSKAVAAALDWPRRGFGDHLRALAERTGGDQNDRALLQELGQNSVQTDVDKFVRDVLADIDWTKTRNVILDGLRHAEVRHALLLYLRERGVELKVVYVEIDERQREEVERKRGVSLRQLATYDRDLTEAQIYDIIPAYADLKVKGSWPQDYAVDTIITRLNLRERPQTAAHA
jgi:cytidylate kinase